MISLTTAARQKKMDECTHTRRITCIPGSGSAYFCDDCGTYLSMSDCPKGTPVHVRKFRDHLLGRDNAYRLW